MKKQIEKEGNYNEYEILQMFDLRTDHYDRKEERRSRRMLRRTHERDYSRDDGRFR